VGIIPHCHPLLFPQTKPIEISFFHNELKMKTMPTNGKSQPTHFCGYIINELKGIQNISPAVPIFFDGLGGGDLVEV
jgi:hypothetical protein